MPSRRYRRRSRYGRRVRKTYRPRYMQRKRRRARAYKRRQRNGDVYSIKHLKVYEDVICGASNSIAFPVAIKLNELPEDIVNSLTITFDFYRIRGIKIQWFPREVVNTPADGEEAPVNAIGEFVTVVEPSEKFSSDFGESLTYTDLLNFSTMKMTRNNRTHTRFFRPSAMVPAYASGNHSDTGGTGTLTGYGLVPKQSPWIGTEFTAVPHVGCYYGAICPGGGSTWGYYVTYYVDFKNRAI